MDVSLDAPRRSPAQFSRSNWRNYLNVTRELAITQFKLKYTGSVLGYIWSLVKPLMIFGIMYFVFAKLLGTGRGAVNFPLQLLVGVVLWTFFSETTSAAVNTIVANGTLVQRAFFPRAILVIATSATAAMTFVINMTLIVLVATPLGKLDLSVRSLVALPLLLELYLLILGFSFLFSALFVYFRDIGHLWEISLQLLFYASAVVFPVTLASHGLQQWLLMSPVAQIIEDMRHALVAPQAPWAASIVGPARMLIPLLMVVAVFAVGTMVFRMLSPRFAENL